MGTKPGEYSYRTSRVGGSAGPASGAAVVSSGENVASRVVKAISRLQGCGLLKSRAPPGGGRGAPRATGGESAARARGHQANPMGERRRVRSRSLGQLDVVD